MKKVLLGLLILIVLAVVAVAVFLSTFKLDMYREQIEVAATNAVGRQVRLSGPMSLSYWPSLAIQIDDVSIANPTWASRRDLLNAGSIDLSIAVMPLLQRRIKVERVLLENISLGLEQTADGSKNWALPMFEQKANTAQAPEQELPAEGGMNNLSLDVSQVVLSNIELSQTIQRHNDTPVIRELTLQRVTFSAPEGQRVAIDVAGLFAGEEFTAGLRAGTLDEIRSQTPFQADLTATAAGSELQAQGTVDLANGPALDMSVIMLGSRFANLTRIIPSHPTLPEGAPYRLGGRIRTNGQAYQLSDVLIEFGQSRLAGGVNVGFKDGRPLVAAELVSETLDPKDFHMEPKDPAVTEDGRATGGRAPVQGGLPWEALAVADTNIGLDLKALQASNGPIGSLKTRIRMAGGRLAVAPIDALIGGGKVTGQIQAESAGQFALALTGDDVDYGAILDALAVSKALEGRTDFAVQLNGGGQTADAIRTSLTGTITVDGGKGLVLTKYIDQKWLDRLRQSSPMPLDFESTVMSCFISTVTMQQGVATITETMLDADKLTLAATGKVQLGSEDVDAVIRLRPNSSVTAGLSAPVKVSGKLGELAVNVDPQGLAQGLGDLVGVNLGGFRVPVNTNPEGGAEACRIAYKQSDKQGTGTAPADSIKSIIRDKAGTDVDQKLDKLPEGAGQAVKGLLDRLR